MSFSESIKRQKEKLQKTVTFVKYVDGRIFKEIKDEHPQFVGKQYGFVVDEMPDKVPAKVIDNIYLGSQDCCEIEVLDKFNIKFVLSIGVEAPIKYDDITYKFIECMDLPETNLTPILRECIPFIEYAVKQHHNILVHCNAGVSRSSSVVIGYLLIDRKYSYLQAYNVVKTARSCINPNAGFEKQLQHLGR
ncbi:MAP kinase-specific phosphatase [Leptinotarsa decemlineata]|uniref:MAP kinase-specific phosphatase n=1 Tax=Leptinotarsa decemlineata TaxID=7539 RepID=UPI003D30A83D